MDTNTCGDCGHNWVSRTLVVSARCPECRSTDTRLCRDYWDVLKTVAIVTVMVVGFPPLALPIGAYYVYHWVT